MDEVLFRVEELLNYSVMLTACDGAECLEIAVYAEDTETCTSQKVLKALEGIPAISKGLADGSLRLAPILSSKAGWFTTGVAKRMIRDCRKQQAGESPLLNRADAASRRVAQSR